MLRKLIPLIFSTVFFKKLLAFGFLILVGYILSDFLVLFFITFLFAYLFLEVGSWLVRVIHDWGLHSKRNKAAELALRYNNTNIIVTILYIVFITILIILFINIIPQIIKDMGDFINNAPRIAGRFQGFVNDIQQGLQIDLGLNKIVDGIINTENLEKFGQTAIGYLKNTGIILTKFIIGLILSYIFVMERYPILKFLSQMKKGNFAFFYEEYEDIASKIGHGFGAILRAQSLIATINAILTTIGLIVISFIHGHHLVPVYFTANSPWIHLYEPLFPFIFTLSLIVLVFGFIPVFGTFISGIPILLIAYGYGGSVSFLLCIAMIAIVHAVEAYYLNPRIVSSYVHIPVFITFIILLVSEHFLGLPGLLIGVPLFIITLGFLEDIDLYISSIKQKLHEI